MRRVQEPEEPCARPLRSRPSAAAARRRCCAPAAAPKSDASTVYENGPLNSKAPDLPPPPKSFTVSTSVSNASTKQTTSKGKKKVSLVHRHYLGILTEADARAAVSERYPLGIFHKLPVSHGHLRRELKRGKDALIVKHNDGEIEVYPIKHGFINQNPKHPGVYVDLTANQTGEITPRFDKVEGLLRFYVKYAGKNLSFY
ncbi:hypothetical protein M3Y99_01447600 [Aphelenchoides fujianensis]|nr:hypothetical protein M3Y99_01447600 [Aphelenchoides fujianensis]